MFDYKRWKSLSFDFRLGNVRYEKEPGVNDYVIDDCTWEFQDSDLAIPELIMAIVDNAPGLLER